MNFKVDIDNQTMKKIAVELDNGEEFEPLNYNYNQYKCIFTFNDDEDSLWIDVDKFAIFSDSFGESLVIHLGEEDIVECPVPNEVLRGSYFKVSVYGGDLVSTNSVTFPLQMSGYINHPDNPDCNLKGLKSVARDVFVEIFEQLGLMVTKVSYNINNKCLDIFSNENLIDSVYIPFITLEECENIAREVFVNLPLATTENDGLLSSDDKIKLDNIDEELNKKVNNFEISSVALSGNYNDLNNIPNEFNPINHTHTASEVIDFKDNAGVEIKRAYNVLINQIRRYGE